MRDDDNEDMRERFETKIEDVSDHVTDVLEDAADKGSATFDEILESLDERGPILEAVQNFVEQKPVEALALAALGGALVGGWLFSRRRA